MTMPQLDDYLAKILARRRADLGDPPSPDRLIAYSEGRLSEKEEEELLDYAAVDSETVPAALSGCFSRGLKSSC